MRNNPNPMRSFAGRVAIVFSQRHGLTRARGGDRAVEAGSAARRKVLAAAKVPLPGESADTPTTCLACPPETNRGNGGGGERRLSLALREIFITGRKCTRACSIHTCRIGLSLTLSGLVSARQRGGAGGGGGGQGLSLTALKKSKVFFLNAQPLKLRKHLAK